MRYRPADRSTPVRPYRPVGVGWRARRRFFIEDGVDPTGVRAGQDAAADAAAPVFKSGVSLQGAGSTDGGGAAAGLENAGRENKDPRRRLAARPSGERMDSETADARARSGHAARGRVSAEDGVDGVVADNDDQPQSAHPSRRSGVPAANPGVDPGAAISALVPGLLMAHRAAYGPGEAAVFSDVRLAVDDEEVERFTDLLLSEDESEVDHFLQAVMARGVSGEVVVLDLLGATADRLGRLWDADERSLADVTLGMCRLHRELRKRQWFGGDRGVETEAAPRVALGTLCGDQHIFGLAVLAERFRCADWRVSIEFGNSTKDVCSGLAEHHLDVLCLSASCSLDEAAARREISGYRKASLNKRLLILVGGKAIGGSEALAHAIGADAVAKGPDAAIEIATRLLEARRAAC